MDAQTGTSPGCAQLNTRSVLVAESPAFGLNSYSVTLVRRSARASEPQTCAALGAAGSLDRSQLLLYLLVVGAECNLPVVDVHAARLARIRQRYGGTPFMTSLIAKSTDPVKGCNRSKKGRCSSCRDHLGLQRSAMGRAARSDSTAEDLATVVVRGRGRPGPDRRCPGVGLCRRRFGRSAAVLTTPTKS